MVPFLYPKVPMKARAPPNLNLLRAPLLAYPIDQSRLTLQLAFG